MKPYSLFHYLSFEVWLSIDTAISCGEDREGLQGGWKEIIGNLFLFICIMKVKIIDGDKSLVKMTLEL